MGRNATHGTENGNAGHADGEVDRDDEAEEHDEHGDEHDEVEHEQEMVGRGEHMCIIDMDIIDDDDDDEDEDEDIDVLLQLPLGGSDAPVLATFPVEAARVSDERSLLAGSVASMQFTSGSDLERLAQTRSLPFGRAATIAAYELRCDGRWHFGSPALPIAGATSNETELEAAPVLLEEIPVAATATAAAAVEPVLLVEQALECCESTDRVASGEAACPTWWCCVVAPPLVLDEEAATTLANDNGRSVVEIVETRSAYEQVAAEAAEEEEEEVLMATSLERSYSTVVGVSMA